MSEYSIGLRVAAAGGVLAAVGAVMVEAVPDSTDSLSISVDESNCRTIHNESNNLVDVAEMAAEEHRHRIYCVSDLGEIAFGVDTQRWVNWIGEFPSIKAAVTQPKQVHSHRETVVYSIFTRLSPGRDGLIGEYKNRQDTAEATTDKSDDSLFWSGSILGLTGVTSGAAGAIGMAFGGRRRDRYQAASR